MKQPLQIVPESAGGAGLQLRGLSFSYGDFTLQPVTYDAGRSIIGLVGPNGAGKTTLMSLVAGLLPGGSGAVAFDGAELSCTQRRKAFAFGSTANIWHPGLTARDYLRLVRSMHPNWSVAQEQAWMERFRLSYTMRVRDASAGMKAKFTIVLALARGAGVLLLDEPWNALDPLARDDLSCELSALNEEQGVCVLVSSHELENLAALCGSLIFMSAGEVVASGKPQELTERADSRGLLDVYKALVR